MTKRGQKFGLVYIFVTVCGKSFLQGQFLLHEGFIALRPEGFKRGLVLGLCFRLNFVAFTILRSVAAPGRC